jgi:hypothetical protein
MRPPAPLVQSIGMRPMPLVRPLRPQRIAVGSPFARSCPCLSSHDPEDDTERVASARPTARAAPPLTNASSCVTAGAQYRGRSRGWWHCHPRVMRAFLRHDLRIDMSIETTSRVPDAVRAVPRFLCFLERQRTSTRLYQLVVTERLPGLRASTRRATLSKTLSAPLTLSTTSAMSSCAALKVARTPNGDANER